MIESPDLEFLTPRPSLRNAVQNRLEEAILRGELKDGQQLVETEIAQWLGVSRGLVREAFRELEKTGIVVHNAYRGTFVRSLSTKRLHELYTLRKKLEEFAIELAIPNMGPEDIADLENHLDRMFVIAEQGDTTGLIEADLQFHRKIYALSNHGMLIDVLNGLSRQTHLFIVLTKAVYTIFPTMKDIAASHVALLNAMREKDIDTARYEIQKHINDVGSRIVEIMENEQKSEAL